MHVTDKTPHQFFLLIDSKATEISVNCENIESLVMVSDNRFTINYFVPLTDLLGRVKGDQLERKIEDYECAEAEFIHKTWQNIRSKLVKRAVNKDL